MRHAEEERTTNTSGDSGLSGPRSRLGLVRAKPSPKPEFKLNKKKKCLQLCRGWVAARTVCQCEDASLSFALLLLDDEDGHKSALEVLTLHHITV